MFCLAQLPNDSNFYISMYPRALSISTDNNRYYLPWHTRVIGSIEARSPPYINHGTLSNFTHSSKLQISNRSLPAPRGKLQSQHSSSIHIFPLSPTGNLTHCLPSRVATTAEPRLMIHEQATAFGTKDTPLVAAHTNTIINVIEDALHTHE